jgi:hypothetical protein
MEIPNVVSCIWDLKVNAIHMEPNGNDTKFKKRIKFILQQMPSLSKASVST